MAVDVSVNLDDGTGNVSWQEITCTFAFPLFSSLFFTLSSSASILYLFFIEVCVFLTFSRIFSAFYLCFCCFSQRLSFLFYLFSIVYTINK